MSAPTAAQAMATAAARLRAAGVPDPARDARLLLAHAASVDATRVTLIAPEEIAPEIAERFENLVALRAVRVPVSQLIGAQVDMPWLGQDVSDDHAIALTVYLRLGRAAVLVPIYLMAFYWYYHIHLWMAPKRYGDP